MSQRWYQREYYLDIKWKDFVDAVIEGVYENDHARAY